MSIPQKRSSSADCHGCEESFTHPRIFCLLTSLEDRPQLEEASHFKKLTYSIHGDPISNKNVRTSLLKRKTHGGLSVIRDVWGIIERNLRKTGHKVDKWYNDINNSIEKLKFELNKIKFKDMFRLNPDAATFIPGQTRTMQHGTTTVPVLATPLPPIHLDLKR